MSFSNDAAVDVSKFLEGISYYEIIGGDKGSTQKPGGLPAVTASHAKCSPSSGVSPPAASSSSSIWTTAKKSPVTTAAKPGKRKVICHSSRERPALPTWCFSQAQTASSSCTSGPATQSAASGAMSAASPVATVPRVLSAARSECSAGASRVPAATVTTTTTGAAVTTTTTGAGGAVKSPCVGPLSANSFYRGRHIRPTLTSQVSPGALTATISPCTGKMAAGAAESGASVPSALSAARSLPHPPPLNQAPALAAAATGGRHVGADRPESAGAAGSVRRRYSLTEYQLLPRPATSPRPESAGAGAGGRLTLCDQCGTLSSNPRRCSCCRRHLPPDSKVLESTGGGQGFRRDVNTTPPPRPLPGAQTVSTLPRAPLSPLVRKSSGLVFNPIKSNQRERRAPRDLAKVPAEPECLTISSDEEASDGEHALAPTSRPGVFVLLRPPVDSSTVSECHTSSSAVHQTHPCLPSLASASSSLPPPAAPSDTAPSGTRAADGGASGGGAPDGGGGALTVAVRTVRVGTHRCMPVEPAVFSRHGFRFRLPPVGAVAAGSCQQLVTVTLPADQVTAAQVHLGDQLATLFLAVSPQLAVVLRQQLRFSHHQLPQQLQQQLPPAAAAAGRGVSDGSLEAVGAMQPHFDPTSPSEQCRRFTVIFEDPLTDECRTGIMDVLRGLGSDRLSEISVDETNAILLRCSPLSDSLSLQYLFPGSSSKTLFKYPAAPSTGSIPVTMDDFMCLEEEQFLNDVIIDFYLKYLVLGRLSPADRNRTHVFSSFFYQRLTTRPRHQRARKLPPSQGPAGLAPESARLSAAQRRHSRVRGWTKNVDIFSKDFLLVPINEHSHWFLAIVCFPGLAGCRRLCSDEPCSPQQCPLPPALPTNCRPPVSTHSALPPVSAVSATSFTSATGTVVMKIGSTLVLPVSNSASVALSHSFSSSSPDQSDSDRDEAEPDDDEDAELRPQESELLLPAAPAPAAAPAAATATAAAAPVAKDPSAVPMDVDEEGGGDCDSESDCPLLEPIKPIDYSQADPLAIKQPCVLILDSLAGPSRSRVVATLRDYLRVEYALKKCGGDSSASGGGDASGGRPFDKASMRGCCVRVPQQDNFTDCGLYVLQYAESFFEFPVLNFRLPLPSLARDWFPAWRVLNKRRHLAALITRLSEHQPPPRTPSTTIAPPGGQQLCGAGKRTSEADSDSAEKTAKHG